MKRKRLGAEAIPYVCGPLTELPTDVREWARDFYVKIADLCEEKIGKRAFVPHEYFDPVERPDPTPKEVDLEERKQICTRTSLLIVVAIAPSWGGGIEVEIANGSEIPAVILAEKERKVSRLLLGNPAVIDVIRYVNEDDALFLLGINIAGYARRRYSFA